MSPWATDDDDDDDDDNVWKKEKKKKLLRSEIFPDEKIRVQNINYLNRFRRQNGVTKVTG